MLADHDPVAEGRDGRLVQDDLALLGMVLRLGEIVDEATREHVDQLDVRVAHEEAAGAAHRDGDLHREGDRGARRGDDRARAPDRVLHAEGRRAGERAVVAVEPAGDRVPREVDDIARVAVQLADDRGEDAAQRGRELLGAALGPQLRGEGLRERREVADIGEQRGAPHAVGHGPAVGERPAPVAGEVGLGPVAGRARCVGRVHGLHGSGRGDAAEASLWGPRA